MPDSNPAVDAASAASAALAVAVVPVASAVTLTPVDVSDIETALLTLVPKMVEETLDEHDNVDGYVINRPKRWDLEQFLSELLPILRRRIVAH